VSISAEHLTRFDHGPGVRSSSSFAVSPARFRGFAQLILEPEAVIFSFESVATMGEAIELGGRHLWIAEPGGPFAEAEIGRDDGAGALMWLAQQPTSASGGKLHHMARRFSRRKSARLSPAIESLPQILPTCSDRW
jgi:hypothetical protein